MTLLDGSKIQQIALQPQSGFHRLQVLHDGSEREIQARWVVDASGRSSLLKRQLGLSKKVDHAANAVWFRVAYPIDINTWSTDPAWHARIRESERSLSTNHLMGSGYWVWLIPLASGSTSIGIVTDASIHPFEELNLFERAMNWLHAHEPQCAEVVEQHRDNIQDFRVLKDYAYSCEQVYSSDRWCLTGEAGVFLDPFYSPGSDLIAISNGLICDLLTRDLNGEQIKKQAVTYNKLFLATTESWIKVYERQYVLMDNAQIMIAKIVRDTAFYWGVFGLLYFHNKFRTIANNPEILKLIDRLKAVSHRIQAFFREWHGIDNSETSDFFFKYYGVDFMPKLHKGMLAGLSDAEFEVQFVSNVRFIEQLGGQLVSTVIEAYANHTEDDAIQSQIQRWQSEPFLAELITLY